MRAMHTGQWSITRSAATAALLAVAAFWTWFAAAAGVIGGPLPDAIAPALLLIVPLLMATMIAAVKPRYGGYGLILVGAFAFWFFADLGAWLMLALPLVVIGTSLAIVGRRLHTQSHNGSHATNAPVGETAA